MLLWLLAYHSLLSQDLSMTVSPKERLQADCNLLACVHEDTFLKRQLKLSSAPGFRTLCVKIGRSLAPTQLC